MGRAGHAAIRNLADGCQPAMTSVLHLTSSRFFGGPERQMLGLARALESDTQTIFASFSEDGLNRAFLDQVRQAGFLGNGLHNDTPHLIAARNEIVGLVKKHGIDILICHGYKAGMVGWFAARKAKIPVIAVSRGWTAESRRVRMYERLDRWMLRRMDRVVCVSRAQADKVIHAGVRPERIAVIHNAIHTERFVEVDPGGRSRLLEYFAPAERPAIHQVVGAAGRLSPEKGFDVLIDAATEVLSRNPEVGFVVFGDGVLRDSLQSRIDRLDIKNRFLLAGFSDQLDDLMPHFSLFVQSSHTEGLPNVLLEALSAGVPVIATEVGGTREILGDNLAGRLVKPGDARALARQIENAINDPHAKIQFSKLGRQIVSREFSFEAQASGYRDLFAEIPFGSEGGIPAAPLLSVPGGLRK